MFSMPKKTSFESRSSSTTRLNGLPFGSTNGGDFSKTSFRCQTGWGHQLGGLSPSEESRAQEALGRVSSLTQGTGKGELLRKVMCFGVVLSVGWRWEDFNWPRGPGRQLGLRIGHCQMVWPEVELRWGRSGDSYDLSKSIWLKRVVSLGCFGVDVNENLYFLRKLIQ